MITPPATTTFKTRLTQRYPWKPSYTPQALNRASTLVRQMMFETDKSAGCFMVDSEGYVRAGLMPTLPTDDSGAVPHMEVNMSDTEFAPAKFPRKVLQQSVTMAPLAEIPDHATAIGDVKIPGVLLAGKTWNGATLADTAEYYLYATPNGVSFCHQKAYV